MMTQRAAVTPDTETDELYENPDVEGDQPQDEKPKGDAWLIANAAEINLARIVHFQAVCKAQRGQRHHHAADFLRRLADVAPVDVIDKLVRLAGRHAGGLHKLGRLLEEAVIALLAIGGNLRAKARHHPRLHALLEIGRYLSGSGRSGV